MRVLRVAIAGALIAAGVFACAVALEYVCLAWAKPAVCPTAIAAPTLAHLRAIYEWCGARLADALGVLALLRLHLVWQAFARVTWSCLWALPFFGVAHGFYVQSTTYVFDHFWTSCVLVTLCASSALVWWIARPGNAPPAPKKRPAK